MRPVNQAFMPGKLNLDNWRAELRPVRDGVRSGTGFSLIELTLITAILGIIGALAYPRYAEALARQRADAAARRLSVDIGLARHLARTQGLRHRVLVPNPGNAYQLESSTDGVNWLPVPDPSMASRGYSVDLNELYQASITQPAGNLPTVMVFDVYGRPLAGAVVKLAVGQCGKSVTLVADQGTVVVSDIKVLEVVAAEMEAMAK